MITEHWTLTEEPEGSIASVHATRRLLRCALIGRPSTRWGNVRKWSRKEELEARSGNWSSRSRSRILKPSQRRSPFAAGIGARSGTVGGEDGTKRPFMDSTRKPSIALPSRELQLQVEWGLGFRMIREEQLSALASIQKSRGREGSGDPQED